MQEEHSSFFVRETFLRFFEKKGHRLLPSFSLIPAQDPTLLWIAAGMAPFKAEFAGIAKPISSRIATCQKCVRADDMEQVGHTTRHHTFFEMLGNFSFGDYFKKEAILWGFELLTQKYKLSQDKLWVSIYPDDNEAYEIWKKDVGFPEAKIVRLQDNFWGPIGLTGTCGPDSEIYYDRGDSASCGKPDCKPGCNNKNDKGELCDRFIELWNLVFTMYHKDENGKLHELPQKNIDTGAGLERLTMILQGKESPYETDLFSPLMKAINPAYEKTSRKLQVATRIVADHARAVIFMMAEGILPSNEGRGYVIRRILRRASLYREDIQNSPPLHELVVPTVKIMGKVYPELLQREDFIKKAISQAEKEFKETLENGLALLQEFIKKGKITGADLFRLHDERGFQFELAKDILQKQGYPVDEKGFQEAMKKQREKSRGLKTVSDVMGKALQAQSTLLPLTKFLGYTQTTAFAKIEAILQNESQLDDIKTGQEAYLVLDQTPFYAESGGQVGDIGMLIWENGKAKILDTKKNEGDTILHRAHILEGTLNRRTQVQAVVNQERRNQIRKHHTATHLLHAALRSILGPQVEQAGSFVSDHYLRLDFSYPQALTDLELLKIERLVNEKVIENLPVGVTLTTLENAKSHGALAFFGEKYGEEVRMVTINEFSKELCGGTHVDRTGDIGHFILLKESSIAKGIRRIEAKAGTSSLDYLEALKKLKSSLSEILKVDFPDIKSQVDLLLSQRHEKEKEISLLKSQLARIQSLAFLEKASHMDGILCVFEVVPAQERETLRVMVEALKEKMDQGIVCLASCQENKVVLVCGVTENLKQILPANELLKTAYSIIGGAGGGRADYAEAGGKDPAQISHAFQKMIATVQERIQKNKEKGVSS